MTCLLFGWFNRPPNDTRILTLENTSKYRINLQIKPNKIQMLRSLFFFKSDSFNLKNIG